MKQSYRIERDGVVTPEKIAKLRMAIGWEGLADRFETSLPQSFCYFSITEENSLIGFARVISDGSLYAFIVDVMIHPEHQKKGLGKQLVLHIREELKKENIRLIQLIFSPELESFYVSCGFSLLKAGSIKNTA